ncbi:hypothetical protein GGR56DRAFT_625268 [Xylariaceae sp. FL0804]|nr:hypothetical protein GGR56DRAFT_625268 [Xylariaceae sp. FL0804]
MSTSVDQDVADLKKEVSLLRRELQRVSDEAEVRKVHHKYGYYLDKCLYNEVVDMYADHPDTYVEFLGSRYRGKAGVARLYNGRFKETFVKGRNGPVHGFLLDHLMLQDIVDVDPSGTHAWCRMRALMQCVDLVLSFFLLRGCLVSSPSRHESLCQGCALGLLSARSLSGQSHLSPNPHIPT